MILNARLPPFEVHLAQRPPQLVLRPRRVSEVAEKIRPVIWCYVEARRSYTELVLVGDVEMIYAVLTQRPRLPFRWCRASNLPPCEARLSHM